MGKSGQGAAGIAAQMEVEAFRRLFPVPFYDRHLSESVRPDARTLDSARETSITLGPVAPADGSALVKIGETVSSFPLSFVLRPSGCNQSLIGALKNCYGLRLNSF
jgi:hypothetical protein